MKLRDYKTPHNTIFQFPLSGKKFQILVEPKKGRRPEFKQVVDMQTGQIFTYDEFSDIIVQIVKN